MVIATSSACDRSCGRVGRNAASAQVQKASGLRHGRPRSNHLSQTYGVKHADDRHANAVHRVVSMSWRPRVMSDLEALRTLVSLVAVLVAMNPGPRAIL